MIGPMATRMASRLEEFFEERTNGNLRSIVKYDKEAHDVVFLTDDVADQYSEDKLLRSVDGSRMESLSAPIYKDTYSGDHGKLTCLVKCFEDVIERNFGLDDGVGATVALDEAAINHNQGLVVEARKIVIEERE